MDLLPTVPLRSCKEELALLDGVKPIFYLLPDYTHLLM